MSKNTAILGKGGVGKTFIAAHLAMSLGYMGVKTLLVGCDLKCDTRHAVSQEVRPSLMDMLEATAFAYDELSMSDLTARVSDYVDVMELGAPPLLSGHFGGVVDEAFHTFDLHQVWDHYDQVVFDITEERFDGNFLPVMRRVENAIAVTTESPESLFVLNRMMRAVLIGANELETPMKILGVVNNRSVQPASFQAFTEKTRLFPIHQVPESEELGSLRHFHRTLLTLENEPPHLKPVVDGFIRIADFLRVDPYVLYQLSPIPDEDIWQLTQPASLPV